MDGSFQPKNLTSDKNQGLSAAFLSGSLQRNIFFADSDGVVPKLEAVAADSAAGVSKVSVPSHPIARLAFVKKFNAINAKRVLAGLPLLVLLLPDMAAAQSSEFVSLNSVEGVSNATVLDNGNVRVTLDNGRRLTIDADSVQITAGGEILVSQAAVGAIGEAVMLAAGGAGAGGAVVAGLLGGAAAMGAGGGGGGGSGSSPETSGGRLIDGYISGATVFRDLNDNGVFDAGEPNVLTDNEGNFSGLAIDASNPDAKIVAFGGTDIATGKAFVGTLSAPADATVVTPITTLVQALVEKAESDGSPITADQAAAQVTTALGLGDSNVLTDDPVKAAEEGDLTALKAATQIANVINLAAAADDDSTEASAQAAESLATVLVNSDNPSDALNDETALQQVLTDAVGAEKANDLAAAASNANTVIDNAADDETGLTQIEQVLTVVQGDVVDDVKAGNDVGETDIAAEASAIVPLRPTLDRGDTEINAASKANGIDFAGTGRPGTEITVDFGGETKTTTAAADGSWSVSYTAAEFPADPADGTVTVSVTAKEDPTDPPSPAATRTISLDSSVPTAPVIEPVATDGTVNGAEAAAGYTVTGTGEAGATVVVSISAATPGGAEKSATVGRDGTWSVTFGSAEVPEDGTHSIEARQTDALGNASDTTTGSFTVDTAATAQPSISTIAGDNVINAAEKAAGVDVTGTAEANASVAVTFGATTKTVTAAADGSYTANFTEAELPGDGRTVVKAVATDAVGNASPEAQYSVELNTAPPGAPTFFVIASDDVVNQAESAAALVFRGTVPEDSTVEVTFNGTTVTASVDDSGEWTADLSAAGLPADGTVSVAATATDATGNTATSSRSFVLDTATATPTINAVSGDDQISASDVGSGVSITGTAEAGAGVAVTIAGGSTVRVTADASGNFTAVFSESDLPKSGSNVEVSALATDAAGNSATGTRSISIDIAPPSTPTISVISGEGTINLAEAAAGVTITGGAEEGASVAVTFGSVTKTVTADAGGGFSASFSSRELPEDGDYTVQATATDAFGNTSDAGSAMVTVDTKAPPVPTIDAIATDDVINAAEKASPQVTGTAEANATVIVKAGATTKTVTADASGNWTASFLESELPTTDLTAPVTARAVDAAGNQSTAALREVTFDTSVAAPVINAVGATTPDLVNAAEKAAGLSVTGTAEVGATVTVTLSGESKTATAAADGSWSVSFTADEQPVTDGVYALTASAVDTAGNTTASPASRPITYDTAAPDAPSVNALSTDNILNAGEITAGGTVTGTAEANATITVDFRVPPEANDSGRSTALQATFESRTTQADENGNWTMSWTSADFPEGTVIVGATATDAAGNTSTETTIDVNVDLTAPTGSIGTIATDDVIGKAEADAGFSVDVTAGADVASVQITIGETTKTASLSEGTYSATFVTAELPDDGTHSVSATVTDSAGNTSTVTRSVTVETQPPAAPVIDDVTADNVVNAAEAGQPLAVSGTAEAGASVSVTLNSNVQTATADATTGAWTVSFAADDLPTTDGDHEISATATDAAGNTGVAGTKSFTLDKTGPDAPSIGTVANDDIINAQEQQDGVDVTGSTEAGASVSVTMTPSGGTAVTKSATADASGNFSVNFTSDEIPTSGSVDFVATATDTAGNQGTASAAKTVVVNTSGTATPTINAIAGDNQINATEATSDVTISGTAEAGASVSFSFGDISRDLTADASGNWSTTIASDDLPSDGSTNVEVTATGTSGVQSAVASQAVSIDTAAPVLTIDSVTADNLVNGPEYDAGVTVSGTTDTNAGDISVTIGSVTKTVTPSGGVWSANFTGAELGADGAKTVTVAQSDAAGNVTSQGAAFTLDAQLTYTVTNHVSAEDAWLDTALSQNANIANATETSFEIVGAAPFNIPDATAVKAIFTGTGFTTNDETPPEVTGGTVTGIAIEYDTGSGLVEAFRIEGFSFDLLEALVATNAEINAGGSGLNALQALFNPYKINMEGSSGNDFLTGGDNGDVINGNDGNDIIRGAGGVDTLDGGAGNDALYFDVRDDSDPASIQADFVAGTATHGGVTDTVSNFEELVVWGDSDVSFTGDSGANYVETEGGDDTINAGGGNDTVKAGAGINTIDTGAGDDEIIIDPTLSGATTITDAGGNDTLVIIDRPGLDDGGLVQDGEGNLVWTSEKTGATTTFEAGAIETARWESAPGASNPFAQDFAISTGSGTVVGDSIWVAGTNSADTINMSEATADHSLSSLFSGGDGADTITTDYSAYVFGRGGSGADSITALGSGSVEYLGDAGNDTLTGSSGDDSLYGGEDDDRLIGGTGDDRIGGGDGTDTVVLAGNLADYGIGIDGSTVTLTNGGETDTIDSVEFFEFADQTVAFADLVSTVPARDITFLQGVDGGLLGTNTFLDPAAVLSNDGSGTQLTSTKTNVADFGGQTVVGTLTGTGFTFDGNGVPTGGTITGSSYTVGGDLVMTTTELNVSLVQMYTALQNAQNGDFAGLQAIYNDTAVNVIGSSGDDTRNGNNVNDIFAGNGGNDRFDGRGGDDSLDGGVGDDSLYGGDGDDTLLGGAGRDHLFGGEGDDVLDSSGDAGDVASQGFGDFAMPGEGNDTIIGHEQAYTGVGGGGVNLEYWGLDSAVTVNISEPMGTGTATAEGKSDTFTYVDHVTGTDYDDSLTGSAGGSGYNFESWIGAGGEDTIDGNGGFDMVFYDFEGGSLGVHVDLGDGSAFDSYGDQDMLIDIDGVMGTSRADVLYGNDQDNELLGREGSDFIFMGGGDDTVEGGDGSDFFAYSSGHDIIADFEFGVDEIDLTGTGASLAEIQGAILGAVESTTAVSGVTSVVVNIDADNSITLGGVTLSEFQTATANLDGVLSRGIEIFDTIVSDHDFDDFFIAPILDNSIPVELVSNTELRFTSNADDNPIGQQIVARVTGTGFAFTDGDISQPTAGEITSISIEVGGDTVITTTEPRIELVDFIAGVAGSTLDDTSSFLEVFAGYRIVWNTDVSSLGERSSELRKSDFTDVLDGSSDEDYFVGSAGNDLIYGNGGGDELEGDDGNDLIIGGDGHDYLEGAEGDDALYGEAGDDYFAPGSGDDLVAGGSGDDDTVSYENAAAAVSVNLAVGTANDGEGGTDTLISIERARGGNFADSLIGDDARNVFAGNAGNDTIDGGDGVDRVRYDREFRLGGDQGVTVDLSTGMATDSFGDTDTLISIERVTGTEYHDGFLGNDEDNDLEGDGGNDTLIGGLGNDWMAGGRGFDHFVYSGGFDTIADFQLGIDSVQFDLVALGISQAELEQAFSNASLSDNGAEVDFGTGKVLNFEGLTVSEVQSIPTGGEKVTPTFDINYLVAGADIDNLLEVTLFDEPASVDVDNGTITVTAVSGETAVFVISDPDIRVRSSGPEIRGGTLETLTFSDALGVAQVSVDFGEVPAMPFFRALFEDIDAVQNQTGDGGALNDFLSAYTQIHNGSSGADLIGGGDYDDVIFGNGGDDLIVSYGGDDIIIGGGGEDTIVLGQVNGFDPISNEPLYDLVGPDGNNDVEVALFPANPGDDFAIIYGFDTSGSDVDFITLTAPGANPFDLGISQVSLVGTGLTLAGSDEASLFAAALQSLTDQQADLTDDAVEVVVMTDGTETAVVRVDVDDAGQVEGAVPLLTLVGVSDLDGVEDSLFYFSPTV